MKRALQEVNFFGPSVMFRSAMFPVSRRFGRKANLERGCGDRGHIVQS
jgi:hypothetical protein